MNPRPSRCKRDVIDVRRLFANTAPIEPLHHNPITTAIWSDFATRHGPGRALQRVIFERLEVLTSYRKRPRFGRTAPHPGPQAPQRYAHLAQSHVAQSPSPVVVGRSNDALRPGTAYGTGPLRCRARSRICRCPTRGMAVACWRYVATGRTQTPCVGSLGPIWHRHNNAAAVGSQVVAHTSDCGHHIHTAHAGRRRPHHVT